MIYAWLFAAYPMIYAWLFAAYPMIYACRYILVSMPCNDLYPVANTTYIYRRTC